MEKYVIGVDIGGTAIKLGIFTLLGSLKYKWAIETNKANDGEYVIKELADSINSKLSEINIDMLSVLGIGVGVPGPVEKDGTIHICVNLGWKQKDVAKELSDMCKTIVKVGNDANLAALGEMWKGIGEGYHNVVFITLGTGVGGGIIVNDKIITGATGIGGEIGHITVDFNENCKCNCGRYGCLEQYSSATALVKIFKSKLENDKSILGQYSDITAKDVMDYAQAGDFIANEAVDVLSEKLGFAFSNIACLLDPEIYVIGGGISESGEFLLKKIRKFYKKYVFYSAKDTKIEKAILGNDAGMYGAAKLIID